MCEHPAQPFPAPRGDYRHARCSASEPTWQSHSGQKCRGADGKAARRGGNEGPRGGDRESGTTLTPRIIGRRRHGRLAGRIPAQPASTPVPAINGSALSASCGYRPFGGAEIGASCHPPFRQCPPTFAGSTPSPGYPFAGRQLKNPKSCQSSNGRPRQATAPLGPYRVLHAATDRFFKLHPARCRNPTTI